MSSNKTPPVPPIESPANRGVCRAKYGELWDKYTAKVKYKIVPGLY